jgi:hypothetical protein
MKNAKDNQHKILTGIDVFFNKFFSYSVEVVIWEPNGIHIWEFKNVCNMDLE